MKKIFAVSILFVAAATSTFAMNSTSSASRKSIDVIAPTTSDMPRPIVNSPHPPDDPFQID